MFMSLLDNERLSQTEMTHFLQPSNNANDHFVESCYNILLSCNFNRKGVVRLEDVRVRKSVMSMYNVKNLIKQQLVLFQDTISYTGHLIINKAWALLWKLYVSRKMRAMIRRAFQVL